MNQNKQSEPAKLLEVRDLEVSFFTPAGEVKAVGGISYDLNEHEVMGIVGESGSGKSVEAYSIIGLLQNPGKVIGGSIVFEGENVLDFDAERMRQFRGNKVSMIFQNPMTCLNPVYTIGDQLMEALTCHNKDISRKEARERAIEMLELVGINNAEKRMDQYPHEFSGGMRQRAMIAMALICSPKLLIADEPTTALDVTIQAQIMELIVELNRKLNMGVILITHDLAVVAETCRRVAVMYLGQIVEEADVRSLFEHPAHPYTRGLLKSIPTVSGGRREELNIIEGTVPLLSQIPRGCRFRPRCPYAVPACAETMPELNVLPSGQKVRCFRAKELSEAR